MNRLICGSRFPLSSDCVNEQADLWFTLSTVRISRKAPFLLTQPNILPCIPVKNETVDVSLIVGRLLFTVKH